MALSAPSTLISHNRAVNCLAFSLPKHGNLAVNHQQLHSRLSFHSFSDPPYVHQRRNGGKFTPSCLSKTVVSDVEVHNSDFTTDAAAAADSKFLLFICSFYLLFLIIFMLNLMDDPMKMKPGLETLLVFFFSLWFPFSIERVNYFNHLF